MEGRRCPVCGGWIKASEEPGFWLCSRCGTESRFEEEQLFSLDIPGYVLKLRDIERRLPEVTREIEKEGARGEERDMSRIRTLHEERQRLLAEFAFLTHFEQMVERHRRE